MKPALFIVGAGGFGREVWNWLEALPVQGRSWSFAGFLDDNPQALAGYDYPLGVVGAIRDHQPDPTALYVCAVGKPQVKERVCAGLAGAGARFLTLVHPTAFVGRNVTLGEGAVLCPGVIVTADVRIGRFVVLNCRSGLGHDVEVGDYSTLSAFCDVTGGARLGRGVFLGSHAVVLPGKTVGDYAVVGAGAVVMNKVAPGVTVYCPPAKTL